MKTFREFVGTNEHLSENVFDQIKNAATMFRYMTNPKSFPRPTPSGPANLSGVYKGSSTPAPKPTRFQIGTPPKTPPSPMGIRGAVTKGGVHGAVASAVLNARNTADGTLDAARRRGDLDKKPGPDQGVGTKPRVAEPYTPPRPAAKVEPKPKPEVTIPRADKPRVDPFAPVNGQNLERPAPRLTGLITTAQSGDNTGSSKSKISTYVDPNASEKQKKTHVGRHLTLAQHRKAVADRKAEEAKKGK